MVSRMVNRYVEQVVDRLPFWAKRSARKDLKDSIYNMLNDYCEGEIPLGRDLRAVLNELGTPVELAEEYYEYRAAIKKHRKLNIRRIFTAIQTVLMMVALLLVTIGLALLTTGLTNNLTMMVVGGLMALAVMVMKQFQPVAEQTHAPEKKRQKAASRVRDR